MDCPIYKKELDPADKNICAKLCEKGCVIINAYAVEWRENPGDYVYVYKDCRRNFTHPRTLKDINSIQHVLLTQTFNQIQGLIMHLMSLES